MKGIKETISKYWDQVKGTTDTLNKIKAATDETRSKLLEVYNKIAALPAGDVKNDLLTKANAAKVELENLEKRHATLSGQHTTILNTLKKLLGMSGLAVAIAIPIAAIAALTIAVAALWKVTVNKTREINLRAKALDMVATGALSPQEFDSFVKQRAEEKAGPMSDIMKLLTIGLLVMVAPPLFSSISRMRH